MYDQSLNWRGQQSRPTIGKCARHADLYLGERYSAGTLSWASGFTNCRTTWPLTKNGVQDDVMYSIWLCLSGSVSSREIRCRRAILLGMNLLKIPLAVLAAGLLFVTPPASAQVLSVAAKELENQHKGEILRVRELVADSKIRYDAAGHLTGKWHAGRWTWHSSVELVGVEAKGDILRIKANRLLLNYDQASQRFASVRAGTIEIDIETAPDIHGNIDPTREWNKAFLTPTEDYPLDMQPYWRPFISCIVRPNTDECRYYEAELQKPDVYNIKPAPSSGWKPNYPGVYALGGNVKPPQMLSKSEPEYTDIARQARVSGTVILEVIIRKNGFAEIVRVVRPLGYGLEESAAEWVLNKAKFAPATLNGSPVDVHLEIVVNFHLY